MEAAPGEQLTISLPDLELPPANNFGFANIVGSTPQDGANLMFGGNDFPNLAGPLNFTNPTGILPIELTVAANPQPPADFDFGQADGTPLCWPGADPLLRHFRTVRSVPSRRRSCPHMWRSLRVSSSMYGVRLL